MSGPIGLGDGHLRALGALAAQAGMLEHLVFEYAIAKSGLSRKMGNLLMGRDNFDAMLNRLGRMIAASEDVDLTTKKRFKAWSGRARSVMDRRDDLFHSAWVTPQVENGLLLRVVRSRDAAEGIPSKQTATTEVDNLAAEIGALSASLMSMTEALGVLA